MTHNTEEELNISDLFAAALRNKTEVLNWGNLLGSSQEHEWYRIATQLISESNVLCPTGTISGDLALMIAVLGTMHAISSISFEAGRLYGRGEILQEFAAIPLVGEKK